VSDATEDTVEIPCTRAFAEYFFAPPQEPFRVTIGAGTHVGHFRPVNEDQFAVIRRIRTRDVLLSSLPDASFPASIETGFALIVADGVGGGAFGELASRLVLELTWELAGRATSWIMRITDVDAQQLRERVQAYVDRVEEHLKELGRDDRQIATMATTWTSAHIFGRDAVITNIGDSRAYLCHKGGVRQITRDHTIGQLLQDAGLPDADRERLRHVLINCLSGDPQSKAFPELHYIQLEEGDRLLLCTDGLTNEVPESDIAHTVHQFRDPQAACDELIRCALARGGRDNVTVVIAALDS
jgi:protein phosphatase